MMERFSNTPEIVSPVPRLRLGDPTVPPPEETRQPTPPAYALPTESLSVEAAMQFAEKFVPEAPRAAPVAYTPGPGEIVIPKRDRLSLGHLFRLEQELARFPEMELVTITVLEDGSAVVNVPPHTLGRAREFLILNGDLPEEST